MATIHFKRTPQTNRRARTKVPVIMVTDKLPPAIIKRPMTPTGKDGLTKPFQKVPL